MGKYELIRQLAAGGMAEVFLAKAAGAMGFEKTVVVKRILPHLASDPLFVEMFLSEAKLAAQLNHPNVVQIFDFGEAEGTYFLAMEYIDGPDLRRLSTKAYEVGNPIPFALCAKILSYACEGLAYAHGYADPETGQPMDLVHRDISPDNIILAKNGAVKVVDFGIAKAAMQLHKTQPGFLKGKLGYMSPEYLNGKPVDCRADVYALGVVLYELVSNKRPYEAESEIALLHAMMFESMTPVRNRRSDVPEELEQIIERALMRDPEERYPSCVELQADLERFIVSVGEPLSAVHLSQLVAELEPGGNDAQGAPAAKTPSRGKLPRASTPAPAPKMPAPAKTPAPRQVASPKVEQPEEVQREEEPQPQVEVSSEPTLHMTLEELLAEQAKLAGGNAKPAATPKPAVKKAESGSRPKVEEPPEKTPAPKAPERKPTKTSASGEKNKSQPPRANASRSNPSLKAKRPEEPKKAPSAPQPMPAPTMPQLKFRMPLIAAAAAGLVLLSGGVAFVIGSKSSKTTEAQAGAPDAGGKQEQIAAGTDNGKTSGEEEETPPERPEPLTPKVPKTPKAPPAANPSLATLKITTNVPAAKVRIGKKQGPAPYTASLMPGKYNVEVVDKATNLLLKTVSYEVKAGEKRSETVTLQKGTLLLNSLPEATVYVDSKSLGTTPAKVEVFEGKHHVRFACPQKPQPYEEDAVVEPGKQSRVVGKCK